MSRVHWLWWVAVGLTLLAAAVTAAVVTGLPENIPTHWNIRGEVDEYGSKSTVWLMPGVMALMIVAYAAIPLVSPKPFDLDSTMAPYRQMMLITVAMVGYIHLIVLGGASGYFLKIDRALMGGICLFLAMIGNLLGKIKRNLYLGIRTPWTIANDRVWADTHRLGAWLIVAAGVLGAVISLILPPLLAMIPIMLAAIIPVVYSYVLYKRLEKRGDV